MEKMSDKELKMMRDLQAKAKRIARFDADCRAWADEHKEELLKRWGLSYTDKESDFLSDTAGYASEDKTPANFL